MATPMNWVNTIAAADLVSAPTSNTDPNVVDTSLLSNVALSATFTGGSSPTMTVTVYFENADGNFYPTGDVLTLDLADQFVYLGNPHGLVLGFTATVSGSPTDHSLYVGERA
mgnify:CR=1 FL=1